MSLSEYVKRDDLRELYHYPMKEASKRLGVSESSLRNICRKHGVDRWPYRKFQQLDAHIDSLKCVDLHQSQTPEESARTGEMISSLEGARSILENEPNLSLEMAIIQANKILQQQQLPHHNFQLTGLPPGLQDPESLTISTSKAASAQPANRKKRSFSTPPRENSFTNSTTHGSNSSSGPTSNRPHFLSFLKIEAKRGPNRTEVNSAPTPNSYSSPLDEDEEISPTPMRKTRPRSQSVTTGPFARTSVPLLQQLQQKSVASNSPMSDSPGSQMLSSGEEPRSPTSSAPPNRRARSRSSNAIYSPYYNRNSSPASSPPTSPKVNSPRSNGQLKPLSRTLSGGYISSQQPLSPTTSQNPIFHQPLNSNPNQGYQLYQQGISYDQNNMQQISFVYSPDQDSQNELGDKGASRKRSKSEYSEDTQPMMPHYSQLQHGDQMATSPSHEVYYNNVLDMNEIPTQQSYDMQNGGVHPNHHVHVPNPSFHQPNAPNASFFSNYNFGNQQNFSAPYFHSQHPHMAHAYPHAYPNNPNFIPAANQQQQFHSHHPMQNNQMFSPLSPQEQHVLNNYLLNNGAEANQSFDSAQQSNWTGQNSSIQFTGSSNVPLVDSSAIDAMTDITPMVNNTNNWPHQSDLLINFPNEDEEQSFNHQLF